MRHVLNLGVGDGVGVEVHLESEYVLLLIFTAEEGTTSITVRNALTQMDLH